MSLTIRQIHPMFVGEVTGVDLSQGIEEQTVQSLVKGLDEFAVLVFRGQSLSPSQQVAVAGKLGPLYVGLRKVHKQVHRFKQEAVSDISNVTENGDIADADSLKTYTMLANQLWHSDGSFQVNAARYSTLHCVVNPPNGSATEFADERAAYDALPADLKTLLEGLRAEHFCLNARLWLGYDRYSEEDKKILPPVQWPLVRVHPGSKRKTLYIGSHATHIIDMHRAHGKLLLNELLERATEREFVYRHDWQVGDFLIWDNRCTLHRGRRYDMTQRRELRRVSTEEVGVALEQAA